LDQAYFPLIVSGVPFCCPHRRVTETVLTGASSNVRVNGSYAVLAGPDLGTIRRCVVEPAFRAVCGTPKEVRINGKHVVRKNDMLVCLGVEPGWMTDGSDNVRVGG